MSRFQKDAEEASAQMMQTIRERTGFPFQENAKEKVYGPPPNLSEPPSGCEVCTHLFSKFYKCFICCFFLSCLD